MAMIDQSYYKCLAIGCLFVAVNRRCTMHDIETGGGGYDNGIIVAGKIMPNHVFLHMCNNNSSSSSSPDNNSTPLDAFLLVIDSIRAFVRSRLRHHDNEIECCFNLPYFEPLVSPHFLKDFKRYLCEKFFAVIKDKNDFFYRAQVLMDYTLSSAGFADHPPSLNAMASFLVAMQEYCCAATENNCDTHCSVMEEMATELIIYYHHNGGCTDLSYLARIVEELRSLIAERERVDEEQEQRRRQDNEHMNHVIPDC